MNKSLVTVMLEQAKCRPEVFGSYRNINFTILEFLFKKHPVIDESIEKTLKDILLQHGPRGSSLTVSINHGPKKCRHTRCLVKKEDLPQNCVFHPDWLVKPNFVICSENCLNGFCICMDDFIVELLVLVLVLVFLYN